MLVINFYFGDLGFISDYFLKGKYPDLTTDWYSVVGNVFVTNIILDAVVPFIETAI